MKTAGRIFIELIVVFIGVFSAFQLNDFRDRKRNDAIKINYYQSFQRELIQISGHNVKMRDSIIQVISMYEQAMEQKQLIPLRYLTGFNVIGEAPIVESAFNDEHFTSIGSYLLINISYGNQYFGWLKDKVDEYNRRVKDMLYGQDRSITAYYQTNGQLKPEYQWYLEELRTIVAMINELERQIHEGAIPSTDQLIKSLE